MGWLGHVTPTVEKRNAYRILLGKPKRKTYLENLGVMVKTILIWILKR
jgi:hypothetical protein